jgi:hypothetical protein
MGAFHEEAVKAGIRRPRYVFDNAKPHAGVSRQSKNKHLRYRVLRIPPGSPDINKPAEHAIANTKAQFWRLLYSQPTGTVTARRAQELLVQAFESAVSTRSVKADIASWPTTLQVIGTAEGETFVGPDGRCHEGSGGDWPPKRYR